MGDSRVTGASFYTHHDKFERYAEGLKSYLGHTVSVKGKHAHEKKEVKVSKAMSKLIKAYYKLSRYENLKESSASKTLNEILANKTLQKEFPKKRLLFKLEKFFIDFFNKHFFAKGRLKHPEIFPKNEISPKVFFDRLGVNTPDFKLQKQNYSVEGSADLDTAVLLLTIKDGRGDAMQVEVTAEDAFAVIKNRANNEVLVRIPLENLTGEAVLEKLLSRLSQGNAFPNSQKILDKLGIVQSEFKENRNGIEYTLKKSEANDSLILTARNAKGEESAFSLVADGADRILLRKMSEGKLGRVVYVFGSAPHALTLDALLERTLLHSGLNTALPKDLNASLAHLRNTRFVRALGSIKLLNEDKILWKAIEMNLDPGRSVKDYSSQTIRKFLDFFSTESLQYTPETTIEELILAIHSSKKETIPSEMGFQAMIFFMDQLQNTTRLSSKDRQFLETYKSRIQDQLVQMRNHEQLWEMADLEKAHNFATSVAADILKKVDSPAYNKVGALVEAGWIETKGGHYISVEVIKQGDQYCFRVANAGAGVRPYHRGVYNQNHELIRGKAITIKRYETSDPDEAQKIISDLFYFKTRIQDDTASKDFYAIFNNATHVEDYAIPARVIQTTANCVLRDQQETFFNVCQRLGRTDLANSFLKTIQINLETSVQNYPALAQELKSKKIKPKIEPLKPGKSRLVLQAANAKEKHLLPIGVRFAAHSFIIGSKADIIPSHAPKQIARQQARLVYQAGNYYVSNYRKPSSKHQVAILRNGQIIQVPRTSRTAAGIKLKKGDQLLLNDLALTVS
jgi:hypothetical protein